MKETFYLIRHGQKAAGINPPLSELGIKQAQAVAEYIALFPIQSIVVSPLLRTVETARKIESCLNLDLVTEDLLKERLSWGDIPNQSGKEFTEMWKRAYVDREWQPLGSCSSVQSGQRLLQAIEKYSTKDSEHIVFVTHAGIITDFLLNTFGLAFLNSIRADFGLKNDKCIHEASVTVVHYNPEGNDFRLGELGATEHLSNDLLIPK